MTSGSTAFLVDTNILVYGFDKSDPEKQERATDIYGRLLDAGTGALSVQILGEFFHVATRRLKPALSPEMAADTVIDFARSWRVLALYMPMVLDASRAVGAYKLSYWDALIWATAKHYGVPYLLSEDMNSGQMIEGVQILNPLTADFDLRILS